MLVLADMRLAGCFRPEPGVETGQRELLLATVAAGGASLTGPPALRPTAVQYADCQHSLELVRSSKKRSRPVNMILQTQPYGKVWRSREKQLLKNCHHHER